MILFAPTAMEMGTMEQICTTGISKLSIVLAIVAPQRVQVPQLDVRIAACTSLRIISWAISSANLLALLTAVVLPTVL